jgi:structural maintenance of chromosome 3 (chondroitin sulfate proteoglycan 6)
VEGAKEHLSEILSRSRDQTQKNEERRERLKSMGEEVTGLRSKVDEMQEQRK